jgi:hypothetical protein
MPSSRDNAAEFGSTPPLYQTGRGLSLKEEKARMIEIAERLLELAGHAQAETNRAPTKTLTQAQSLAIEDFKPREGQRNS